MSKRRRNEPHSDEEYVNGDEEPPSKRPRTENGAMDTEEYLDYKTNEEVRNFNGGSCSVQINFFKF